MRTAPHLRWTGIAVGAVAAISTAACASAPQESRVVKEHTKLEISTAQLRVHVRSLARPFSGIVEGVADEILRHTSTPEERIAALYLKINGVPAIQGALYESDPVAAMFETAALIEQTRIYVLEGPAAGQPESIRAGVLSSIDQMRGRLQTLGDQLGATPDGTARFWSTAEQWAREHPIAGSFASRETTQALFSEYLASPSGGVMAVARRAEETAADLASRFDLYAEYVAKQIRWQAELLLEEALQAGVVERAMSSVEPVRVGVAELPVDLEAEREAVVRALQAERLLILDWVRAERIDTLDYITGERLAIAELAADERELVLAAIRAEREIILAELAKERASAMQDVARIAAESIETSRARVVDHLILRIAQLLAVVLPLLVAAAWLLIRLARRP